jgi:hypothetical protein
MRAEYSIPIMQGNEIYLVKLRLGVFDRENVIEIEIPDGVGNTVQLPADLFAPRVRDLLMKLERVEP